MSAVAAPPEDERPQPTESTPDRAVRLLRALEAKLRAEPWHSPPRALEMAWEAGEDFLLRDMKLARQALDSVNGDRLWNMTADEVLAVIPRAIEAVRA